MCNLHRDLLPNIYTAYFCNIGMEKPHKHWVYAASVGGELGIRTLGTLRTQHFECCTFDHSDNSPDIDLLCEKLSHHDGYYIK